MLALIDESGCPGFKFTKGSTPYFIIAMIIFEDLNEAQKAGKAITNLKEKLKINPEFKFSKTCASVKDNFFQQCIKYNFKVCALVIDKRAIYSKHLRQETDAFYNYFVKNLIKNDYNILKNASIKIDGSGDRKFKNALSVYLRKEVSENKIKKLKFIDSKKDTLIQLADMVVGAIARHYNDTRTDKSRWFELLEKSGKIKNIWDFK